jgi:hypothetical protein
MAKGIASALVLLLACREDRRATETTTTGAGLDTVSNDTVANETAIERITTARCNREQACAELGHVAAGGALRCSAEVRNAIQNELSRAECPWGVDRAALDGCVNAIRDERCGAAFDSFTISACRTRDLCRERASAAR